MTLRPRISPSKRIAALFITTLLLAACSPIVPVPDIADGLECLIVLPNGAIVSCADVNPPIPPAARDSACAPIIPFDAMAAGQSASAGGLPVGWSFGMNFDLLREGRPLACLRLYHLVEGANPEMVAVDRGGILVDRCSAGAALATDFAGGEAAFCGNSNVTCALNLGAWFTSSAVAALVSQSDYGRQDPAAAANVAALTRDGDLAPYPSLTLVARTRWASPEEVDSSCRLTPNDQPLFNFTPAGKSEPQHALTLFPLQAESALTFGPGCPETHWFVNDEWNTTYTTLYTNSTGIVRRYENLLSATPSGACDAPATNIHFWLGPGILTIGELEGRSTSGISDGILIDPLDSRPPG